MHSYFGKALLGIVGFCLLIATPGIFQLRRSLPCEGEVMDVKESQSQQRDSDGVSSIVFISTHEIRFRNPHTGGVETKFLDDIYKDKGVKVRLRYDPSNKSIELDDPFRIFKTPLWIFGTMFAFWLLIYLIVTRT